MRLYCLSQFSRNGHVTGEEQSKPKYAERLLLQSQPILLLELMPIQRHRWGMTDNHLLRLTEERGRLVEASPVWLLWGQELCLQIGQQGCLIFFPKTKNNSEFCHTENVKPFTSFKLTCLTGVEKL